jgi:hypothetical protein
VLSNPLYAGPPADSMSPPPLTPAQMAALGGGGGASTSAAAGAGAGAGAGGSATSSRRRNTQPVKEVKNMHKLLMPPLFQLLRNVSLWTDFFCRWSSAPTVAPIPTHLSQHLYSDGV